MSNFATLTAAMNMNIKNFADGMRDAARLTSKFAADLNGKISNGLIEPAKKAKVEYKDVARMVQGIMISKVFYSGLGAIRNATNAVWEFSKSLEYAEIAYSNLFGSAELATEFINVLEDFAAKTPFSFSEAEASSKRLLAYGVEYKNVMYMMQGIMAASAMQGNPEVIERVSRSMGQIYTKGRLMNEEMRQLAEAGIPAYQILREELGLTQEQLQNLGDEAIPASTAINALIEGMNKRFSGVVSASAMTMAGLISNIKDNALMMAQSITAPLYDSVKEGLEVIYNFMAEARTILDTRGLGGLFEFVVPETFRPTIKAFIANLMNLGTAIKPLLASVWELTKAITYGLVQAFNIIGPVIIPMINIFSNLVYMLAANRYATSALAGVLVACASAWFLFKVQAAGAMIITTVASAIRLCAGAVWFLATALLAHPIFTILTAIAAALIFVAISSTKAGAAIQAFFSKLTAFAGVDPDKLLLPEQADRAADIEKFNEALDGTSDSMSELAKETNKANKSLLSFDEVYKLVDEAGSGGIDTPGIELPEMPDTPGIDLPEMPDFTDYGKTFVDSLWDALKDAFGGKNFGEIVSSLFWEPLKKAFGFVDTQGIAILVTSAVGGLLTGLTTLLDDLFGGFKFGKLKIPWASMIDDEGKISLKLGFKNLKAAIKEAFDLINWPKFKVPWAKMLDDGAEVLPPFSGLKNLGTKISEALKKAFSKASLAGFIDDTKAVWKLMMKEIAENGLLGGLKNIGKAIDDVLKAAIAGLAGGGLKASFTSFMKGFIVGAIADLIAGFFASLWAAKIKEVFKLGEEDLKNAGIGMTLGGILGGIIGAAFGPLGSIVGVIVGDFVGSILGVFWNRTVEDLTAMKDRWQQVFVDNFNLGDGRPIGEKILALFQGAFGFIITPLEFMWKAWFKPIIDGIGALFGVEVSGPIEGFFSGIGTAIMNFVNGAGTSIPAWLDGLKTGFVTFCVGAGLDFFTFLTTTQTNITTFIDTAWLNFTTWLTNLKLGFDNWFLGVSTGFITFFTGLILNIVTFFTTAYENVVTWINNTFTSFTTWWSTVTTGFVTFFTGLLLNIVTFFTTSYNNVVTWINDTVNALVGWFTTNSSGFTTFFSDILGKLGGWISETAGAIAGWIGSTLGAFGGWWAGVINGFNGWVGSILGTIGNFAANAYGALANWVNSLYSMFSGWWSSVINGFYNFGSGIYNAIAGWIGKAASLIQGLIDAAKSAVSAISSVFSSSSSSSTKLYGTASGGHAKGGVFNKEHVANFAEGNKAEAIIPLENNSAMQPFVDAVSNGLLSVLAPMMANTGSQGSDMRPLYVGTLIADDKGLKELNRKMQVIQLAETARKG